MPDFLLATQEFTDADRDRARRLLESLRCVPALAPRYAGAAAPTSLADMATVPLMLKDDLQVALAHLKPRARRGATWVFQSGGSTGAPQVAPPR